MRRILLVLLLLQLFYTANAQVIVNLQIPQAGVHLNSQLWNMTLINASGLANEIRIDMILTNATSGESMLSGSSREFILEKGTKQIQLTELLPIQYNLLNAQFGASISPDGFLPVGNLLVCFSIFKKSGEVYEKIAEECENLVVEPASPPFLIFPEDESKIDENRPFFTWLPPAPLFLFNNLSYNLVLVEVQSNQNTSDAIQNNFPLLQQDDILNPLLQYPFSLAALDTGKLYAWQVKVLNNQQAVSNTEIFSFRLLSDTDSLSTVTKLYVQLKNLNEIPFTICRGVLKYEYVNTQNFSTIRLELIDVTTQTNVNVSLAALEQPLVYGQNFLSLDLSNNNAMKKNNIYQLVAHTKTGEKSAVKFIYLPTE